MADKDDEDTVIPGEGDEWIDRDDDRAPSLFVDRDDEGPFEEPPMDDLPPPTRPASPASPATSTASTDAKTNANTDANTRARSAGDALEDDPLFSTFPDDLGELDDELLEYAADQPDNAQAADRIDDLADFADEDLNALAARDLEELDDDGFFSEDEDDPAAADEFEDEATGDDFAATLGDRMDVRRDALALASAAPAATAVQRAQEFPAPADPYAEDAYEEDMNEKDEFAAISASSGPEEEDEFSDDEYDDEYEDAYEDGEDEDDEYEDDDEVDEIEDDVVVTRPPLAGGPPAMDNVAEPEPGAGRRWPLAMLAVALLALGLLAVGGYGVMKERSDMQAEIRQLQGRLATAVSPDDARANRELAQEVSLRNESLQAEIDGLKLENSELTATIDGLEGKLQQEAAGAAQLQAERKKAEQAAQQATERARVAAREAAAARQAAASREASGARVTTPSRPLVVDSAVLGSWFVNFGSYAQPAVANRWLARLKVESGRVVVQEAIAGGKLVYRVRVIDLPSQDTANRVARKLESAYELPRLWVGKGQ